MGRVEDYYNHQYDEWGRLERHRIEFEITRRVLDKYIKPSSEVLDVGGGPGRYSIYLAKQGHKVTLFDLSEMLVKQVNENAEKAGVSLESVVQGNVLELDNILPGSTYDTVLCMGPMYHLLEEDERREAIRQCLNHLKPGGIFIAAFISVYATIIDLLKSSPDKISEYKEHYLQLFNDGRSYAEYGFTDAYFIHPDNIESQFSGFNLETIRIMATEGYGALREDSMKLLDEGVFQEWMDLLYEIANHKVISGSCEHLLYIGRKV